MATSFVNVIQLTSYATDRQTDTWENSLLINLLSKEESREQNRNKHHEWITINHSLTHLTCLQSIEKLSIDRLCATKEKWNKTEKERNLPLSFVHVEMGGRKTRSLTITYRRTSRSFSPGPPTTSRQLRQRSRGEWTGCANHFNISVFLFQVKFPVVFIRKSIGEPFLEITLRCLPLVNDITWSLVIGESRRGNGSARGIEINSVKEGKKVHYYVSL